MPARAGNCRAIFDLAHLATLSGEPGHCLFLSPKTLYILQNLVVAEVQCLERYAIEMLDDGYYVPCQPWMDCYEDALETIEGVEREVYPVPVYGFCGTHTEQRQHICTEDNFYLFEFEVPENETWEVQALAVNCFERIVGAQFLILDPDGPETAVLHSVTSIPQFAWEVWAGRVVVKAGGVVEVAVYNCLTDDTLVATVHAGKLVTE